MYIFIFKEHFGYTKYAPFNIDGNSNYFIPVKNQEHNLERDTIFHRDVFQLISTTQQLVIEVNLQQLVPASCAEYQLSAVS